MRKAKKYKNLIIILSFLVLGVVFLVWGMATTPKVSRTWEDTQVACLPNGHQDLAAHVHPTLRILEDGQPETVPSGIGLSADCMAEIHTHDSSGELHVETVEAERIHQLTLADLFAVWGREYERDGYTATLSVNGEEVSGPEAVRFEDNDEIEIHYRSTGTTSATSSEANSTSTDGREGQVEQETFEL